MHENSRLINYQRLMRASLDAQRRAYFVLRGRVNGRLVPPWHGDDPEATKWHRPRSPAFTLVRAKPFYTDGDVSMRVAAFRVIKTIHLHVDTTTRWTHSFFFRLSSLFFLLLFFTRLFFGDAFHSDPQSYSSVPADCDGNAL